MATCSSCGATLKDPGAACPSCGRSPTPAASPQDLEHLRLLSIFHYVLAGITALFSLFPIIHVALGVLIATGQMDEFDRGQGPPKAFGCAFAIFGCAFIAFGLAFAGLLIASGRFLTQRRRRLFCLIVAGLSCLMMPFGTVLGVFTLVVLSRPQVQALFDAPAP